MHDDTRHNLRVGLFLLALFVGAILLGRCSVQPAQAQQTHRVYLPMVLGGANIIVSSTIVSSTTTTSSTTTLPGCLNARLEAVPTQTLFHLGQESDPVLIRFAGCGMANPMYMHFSEGDIGYVLMTVQDSHHAVAAIPKAALMAVLVARGPFNSIIYCQVGEATSEFANLGIEF